MTATYKKADKYVRVSSIVRGQIADRLFFDRLANELGVL